MSVNSRHAIPKNKRHDRWGKNYFTIDFELSDNISNKQYENQYEKGAYRPVVGEIEIGGHIIPVTQKEMERLRETINDGISTIDTAYRLGKFK